MTCQTLPSDAVLHLAVPSDWTDAAQDGVYRRSWRHGSLAEVGFIHCSFPHQIEATANLLYADLSQLLVLHVDPRRCDGPVVVEAGTGDSAQDFPHLYAAIPIDAVNTVHSWPQGPDGTFVITDLRPSDIV